MKVFETVDEMRGWSRAEKAACRRVAFVPTMGALHEGHLALVREGKRRGSLAVSIYVNPTQFGPNEDLARYPREIEADLEKLGAAGADAVFVPTDETMYPDGFETRVSLDGLTAGLCGASRPGHFEGVATVVAKLFNIVEPDVAVFGEKDFQQLAVIRRMVKDLDMPVEIVGCPTVREPDGLAMSSRNKNLSAEHRRQAASLHRSLRMAEEMALGGEREAASILAAVRGAIESERDAKIDYASIVDPKTLHKMRRLDGPALLALAVWFGGTRLIDNTVLGRQT